MNHTISKIMESISIDSITEERKTVLQPLADYIQSVKYLSRNFNFGCILF